MKFHRGAKRFTTFACVDDSEIRCNAKSEKIVKVKHQEFLAIVREIDSH